MKEVNVNDKVMKVTMDIQELSNTMKDQKQLKEKLKEQLEALHEGFGKRWSFPLDSRMENEVFLTEKCKIMSSKKKPL